MCAELQRVCQDDCSWGEWIEMVPPGECVAGETTCNPPELDSVCNEDCELVDNLCCPPVFDVPDCCREGGPSGASAECKATGESS